MREVSSSLTPDLGCFHAGTLQSRDAPSESTLRTPVPGERLPVDIDRAAASMPATVEIVSSSSGA